MTALDERFNRVFEELVPDSGKADTVAGEIVRAAGRIGYRLYNDGDHIGVGYGKETCNPAARYLAARAGGRVERAISDMWGIEDDSTYEEREQVLVKEVLDYLELHPELRTEENTEDMWDFRDDEEDIDEPEDDEEWEDEDDWDEYEEDEE